MTRGYVRPTRWEDIPLIADDMREADVAEVRAVSGDTPRDALVKGFQADGETMTICLPNGYPVGMYGVVPMVPGVGGIWMLAANGIKHVHRQFLRESRAKINELCQGYRLVFNFTDARNHVHHRWIKWAGFTFINRRMDFGVEQREFLEFVRIVEKQDV